MNTEELMQLIENYNIAEAAQVSRRKDIFTAFHERKGYRMLRVGKDSVWSVNQCNGSLAQDLKAVQSRLPGVFIVIEELGTIKASQERS